MAKATGTKPLVNPFATWKRWVGAFMLLALGAAMFAAIGVGLRYWKRAEMEERIEINRRYVRPPTKASDPSQTQQR